MENLLPMKLALGNQLRQAREAKNKRLIDAEIATGICSKALSLIENGKHNPCLDTLCRYAAYLGLELTFSGEKE